MGGERRNFLGWDGPFLPRAARALIDSRRGREGASALDFSACVVVLPGRRAARRFEELCAALAGDAWIPPRFVTEGALPDVLARETLATASSLAMSLAWRRALQLLPARDAEVLFARAPSERTLGDELSLAHALERSSAELASEGLSFAQVAERPFSSDQERQRWGVLARLEAACSSLLASSELLDPARIASELARRALVRDDLEIWLVAAIDLSGTQRALLERVPRVTSLVFAPAELADHFDEWGALIPGAWAERDLPLGGEQWSVVQDADDQARGAVRWLRELTGGARAFEPEDVTIGALDPALVPHLQRRLAEAGVDSHWAGGTPLERALPIRLLRAAQAFARTSGWAELASLARHPDVEAPLQDCFGLRSADLPSAFDAYHREHVPARASESWFFDRAGNGTLVARAHFALLQVLGPFAKAQRLALSAWSVELRYFLGRVYPSFDRAASDLGERIRAEALVRVAEVLGELDLMQGTELEPRELSADEALELVLDRLSRESIASPSARGAVEIAGWLELALDEASALLLAGWNEGHVPSPAPADPFLHEALRRELGLRGEQRRSARDAYAAEAILRSREHVCVQSSRRGADGEPARPSRFTFRCPPADVLERVERFFRRAAQAPVPVASAPPAQRRTLAFGKPRAVTSMRATSFRTFLESPYLFYLQCVLQLDTLDDAALELDPRGFGILAHDALQAFGASALSDSRDEGAIAGFLGRELDRLAQEKLGANALPAALLQVEQLRSRLAGFAGWQARRAAEGWKIAAVEVDGAFALEVDGEPMSIRGRIDRIDYHPEHGWCVLDYKTGERGEGPEKARRRDGSWVDLQLPLYREMVRERCGDETVRLGYVLLPPDPALAGEQLGSWTDVDLESALEEARDVVRKVRAGDFASTGERAPRERIFALLSGFDVLGAVEGEDALVEAGPGEESP